MNRKVLLVEPNYKNKYPPLSLMKLSQYHRMLGDEVKFYKGTQANFALNETMKLLLTKLKNNDPSVNWSKYWNEIAQYIKHGGDAKLHTISNLSKNPFDEMYNNPLVKLNLQWYRKYFQTKKYLENPQWDRICITTLFTFYWRETIETINFFKQFCKEPDQVFVGGIAATVVPENMRLEIGSDVRIIQGLLDQGGELDKDVDIIIDDLPLDYSILEEIDYIYPERDAYYGYMTRGCVNRCSFCVVPKLEPDYKSHIPIKENIEKTRDRFGEKRNLLLLDNNVLASEEFDNIIDEIKAAGFDKKTMYIEPNFYDIAINNLRDYYNVPAYIKSIVKLYQELLDKSNEQDKEKIQKILAENYLLDVHTATRDKILAVDDFFKDKFAKLYSSKPKKRYVDFNQGIDSRLINEHNIKRLAEIPINPLRIAFDHWELRDIYEKAVRLAAEAGIKSLSNYLLYNYKDKPLDLYYRMKLNVELCEELGISIYSFPMKYHPISDPNYFRNRDFIGKHWNRKFIRAIQAVLNSTKGKIGKSKSFFYKAFGANENDFETLLYMPETMIIYRNHFEKNGQVFQWHENFSNLSEDKLTQLKEIVGKNDFSNIESLTNDYDILKVLFYYTIKRNDVETVKIT